MKENCITIANINGQNEKFTSDMEVDNFVYSLKNNPNYLINTVDKTFSYTNPIEIRKKLIDSSKILWKEHSDRFVIDPNGEGEWVYDSTGKDSIAIGQYARNFGTLDNMLNNAGTTLTRKFDEQEWENNIREKLRIEKNIVGEAANVLINRTKKNWEYSGKIGEEVHAILNYVIRSSYSKTAEYPELKYLSRKQADNLEHQFKDLLKQIEDQHGSVQFISELRIQTELNSKIAERISTPEKKITKLDGRIDLIFVTNDNKVHVADLKVSGKNIGDWDNRSNTNKHVFHSLKKLETEYQLSFYQNALAKEGYEMGSATVFPVKLDFEYNGNVIFEDDPTFGREVTNIENIEYNANEVSGSIPFKGYIKQQIKGITRDGNITAEVKDILGMQEVTISSTEAVTNAKQIMAAVYGEKLGQTELVEGNTITFDFAKNGRNEKGDGKKWGTIDKSHSINKDHQNDPFNYVIYRRSRLGNEFPDQYVRTEEELDEKLKRFVDDVNRKEKNLLPSMADMIRQAIEEKDLDMLQYRNTGGNRAALDENLVREMRRYVKQGWKLISSESEELEGYFIFQKDKTLQILKMSNKDLYRKIPFKRNNVENERNNILGLFMSDESANWTQTLPATEGALEIIKTVVWFNEEVGLSDRFKGYKIDRIRVFNPVLEANSESMYEDPVMERVMKTFENFVIHHSNYVGKTLLKNNIGDLYNYDSVSTAVSQALFEVADLPKCRIKINNAKGTDLNKVGIEVLYDTRDIGNRITALVNLKNALLQGSTEVNKNLQSSEIGKAVYHLDLAIALMKGARPVMERDLGKYFRGISPMGIMMTSYSLSESHNYITQGVLMEQMATFIRNQIRHYTEDTYTTFDEFYREKTSKLMGGEWWYSSEWILKDGNGKTDPDFLFINPNPEERGYSQWSALSPKSKKAYQLFLTKFNEIRGYDVENTQYYEVPLTQGRIGEQIARGEGFIGKVRLMKKRAGEAFQPFVDLMGQVQEKAEFEKDMVKLHNRFKISTESRRDLINKYGVDYFSQDCELFLHLGAEEYAREFASEEYLPGMYIIQQMSYYSTLNGGPDQSKVADAMERYLKVALLNVPHMEKDLINPHRILSFAKSFTSYAALTLNVRSGVREMLQGQWIGMSRAMVEYLDPEIGFNMYDYTRATTYILKECANSFSKLHLLELMNLDYGMANVSLNEIHPELSRNKVGFFNMNSNIAFVFNKAPDFLHRMTILVAQMMHEGVWEAHSLVDNKLKYDFNKDPRFRILREGDKKHPEYNNQLERYKMMMDQFAVEDWRQISTYDKTQNKVTQDLPRAYTVKQAKTFKYFSELCFGHYDAETKALICTTFLGAYVTHFRTFMIAKLEQWMMKPGTYSFEKHVPKIDEITGERIYKVVTFGDANKEEIIKIDYITGDANLPTGNNIEIYPEWDWKGIEFEGIFYSMLDFGKVLYSMDAEQWKLFFRDKRKRANFILFAWDMLLMGALQIITALLFNYDETIKDPGFKRFVMTSIHGSFEDAQIHHLAGSMFGDLNPPVWKMLPQIFGNTVDYLTGQKNFGELIGNSFGALKDVQALWVATENTVEDIVE